MAVCQFGCLTGCPGSRVCSVMVVCQSFGRSYGSLSVFCMSWTRVWSVMVVCQSFGKSYGSLSVLCMSWTRVCSVMVVCQSWLSVWSVMVVCQSFRKRGEPWTKNTRSSSTQEYLVLTLVGLCSSAIVGYALFELTIYVMHVIHCLVCVHCLLSSQTAVSL